MADQRLAPNWSNFGTWLGDYLSKIRSGFENGDKGSILGQIQKSIKFYDSSTSAVAPEQPIAWVCPTIYTGADFAKNFGYDRPWINVFRNCDDLKIVQEIINTLRVPALRTHGIKSIRVFIPMPIDLLWRLALEGRWGRIGVLLWVHQFVVCPTFDADADASFRTAIENLHLLKNGELGVSQRRQTLQEMSHWQQQSGNIAIYAEALRNVFATQQPDADAVHRAIVLLLQFCPSEFDEDVLWQKLESIVLRDPDYIPTALRTPTAVSALVEDLESFFKSFVGTQREKLAHLNANWIERFRQCDQADKGELAKMLRKSLSSKKLKADVLELIDMLAVAGDYADS